jgi:ParB-like chromosome segregation protein Spo0J
MQAGGGESREASDGNLAAALVQGDGVGSDYRSQIRKDENGFDVLGVNKMLLGQITVDPSRFQFRDTAYSQRTVSAIVGEGINLAKFDAIPVIRAGRNRFIVAGDGHSRYEAIRQLAGSGRLPRQWKVKGGRRGWDVPCRIVTEAEARTLSWTANLSRDDFSASEEAKVFQAMLDEVKDIEVVARLVHKSVGYIQKTLPLNCLCRDIRIMIGKPEDAGGVDKYIAQAMAERFQRYGIDIGQQQQLWHRVFKNCSLTSRFVREVLDRIGQAAAVKGGDGVLFALPANVETIVADFKDRANQVRRAERGLGWLLGVKDCGILDDLPELKALLDRRGQSMLACVRAKVTADADLIGQLCAA